MTSPNMYHSQGHAYMMAPPMLASAGHHGDMAHVWSLVEELSGLLESNRTQFQELRDRIAAQDVALAEKKGDAGVEVGRDRRDGSENGKHVDDGMDVEKDKDDMGGAAVEGKDDHVMADKPSTDEPPADEPAAHGTSENGNKSATHDPHDTDNPPQETPPTTDQAPTDKTTQLVAELSEAERYIATLEKAYTDQSELLTMYETGLQQVTHKLRTHVYEQSTSTLALHSHYTAQLQQARAETLAAHLTHQAWQASFSRVSENLRKVVEINEAATAPYRRRVAGLKEENRVLRARVGWEPLSDSEDEGEVEEISHGSADARAGSPRG